MNKVGQKKSDHKAGEDPFKPYGKRSNVRIEVLTHRCILYYFLEHSLIDLEQNEKKCNKEGDANGSGSHPRYQRLKISQLILVCFPELA